MTALFKKLNFKNQCPIFILDSPESFAGELKAMAACTTVKTSFEEKDVANFVLAFATRQAEVDAFANLFSEKTAGDAIAWIAYPKGSSKRFKCDFNRDTGWQLLGDYGFEPVRAAAIDADWSALRFRRVGFIKTMTRSFALTEEGKKKAGLKTD